MSMDADVVYGVIAKEIEPLKAAIAYFKEHIDKYWTKNSKGLIVK